MFNPVALRIHDHNADGRLDAADEANFLATWQPEDPAVAVPPQWRRPRGPVVDVLADGAYDVIDFLTFQTCLGRDSAGCVLLFDINKDAVVDITDYELYAHTWAGPDEPHNFARGSKYGNPFLWTGQRYEAETGLYHFVYRSYSPTLGRWLQRDPLGPLNAAPIELPPIEFAGAPKTTKLQIDPGTEFDGLQSLYAYIQSRPSTGTDPFGSFALLDRLNAAYTHAYVAVNFTSAERTARDITLGLFAMVNLYFLIVDSEYQNIVAAQPDFLTGMLRADFMLLARGGASLRSLAARAPETFARLTRMGVIGGEAGSVAARFQEIDLGNKLAYIFGRATGSTHNVQRSAGMAAELAKIGIRAGPEGEAMVAAHLRQAALESGNIVATQANGRVVRESLLAGPNGFVKIQSIWEGGRLITVTIFGGG